MGRMCINQTGRKAISYLIITFVQIKFKASYIYVVSKRSIILVFMNTNDILPSGCILDVSQRTALYLYRERDVFPRVYRIVAY